MKKDNKGFSLVELIVVVAIMAVLMTVLAPQLLRYVERTRLQKDNSAIAEIANAVKIAMANETINSAVDNGATITITTSTGNPATITFKTAGVVKADGTTAIAALANELDAVIGATYTTSSNAYNTSDVNIVLEIEKDGVNNSVKVIGGWIANVGDDPTDATSAADDVVF